MIDETPVQVGEIKRPRRGFGACHEPAGRPRPVSGGGQDVPPDDLIELRQGARVIEKSK
jgi:hypothetical protein